MMEPRKILLQTTIPTAEDDWLIARFSSLAALLRDARDESGNALYEVTERDREPPAKPDSVLSTIDSSDFNQLGCLQSIPETVLRRRIALPSPASGRMAGDCS